MVLVITRQTRHFHKIYLFQFHQHNYKKYKNVDIVIITNKIQSIQIFILINLIILFPPELMFLLDQRVSNGVWAPARPAVLCWYSVYSLCCLWTWVRINTSVETRTNIQHSPTQPRALLETVYMNHIRLQLTWKCWCRTEMSNPILNLLAPSCGRGESAEKLGTTFIKLFYSPFSRLPPL